MAPKYNNAVIESDSILSIDLYDILITSATKISLAHQCFVQSEDHIFAKRISNILQP